MTSPLKPLGVVTLAVVASLGCTTPGARVEDASDTSGEPSAAGFSFRQKLPLDSFGVVGIAAGADGTLWLSDADNNRIVRLRPDGQVLDAVGDFDRPMHIATRDGRILVAEYGADRITGLRGDARASLPFTQTFDAPSGVDVLGGRRAVADFYGHRIVYTAGDRDLSFGSKGKGPGEFTYPTDVQFAHDKIWVADAYNHRVQAFDLGGQHVLTFGETEGMNAATGLYVSEDAVYVTDFENSRIQVYDLAGRHRGTLRESLDKPTDVLAVGDTLYAVNYAGRSLSAFTKN